VSKKKVVPENAVFLNISKGYYAPNGMKRYQRSIGFPPEEEIITGLIEKLGTIWSSVTPDEIQDPAEQASPAEQTSPEVQAEPAQDEDELED